MQICSNCGKTIVAGSCFCANCGTAVKPVKSSACAVPENPFELRFVCPHCGTELMGDSREAGAIYSCLKCGKEVQVPARSISMIQPSSLSAPSFVPLTPTGRHGRCKHCSHSIPVGTTPCPYCGHELKWPTKIPPPTIEKARPSHPTASQIVGKIAKETAKETAVATIDWTLGCLLLTIALAIPCCIAISKIKSTWSECMP